MNLIDKEIFEFFSLLENHHKTLKNDFRPIEGINRLLAFLYQKNVDKVMEIYESMLECPSIALRYLSSKDLKPLEDWVSKAYSDENILLNFLYKKGKSTYFKSLGDSWTITINYDSGQDVVHTQVRNNFMSDKTLHLISANNNLIDNKNIITDFNIQQFDVIYSLALIHAAVFYIKYIDEETIQFREIKELITSLLEASDRENTQDVINLGNKLTELIKTKSKYNDSIIGTILKPLEELVIKLYTKGELYRKVFLEEKHTRFFNITSYGFSVEILPNKPVTGDILYSLNNGNKSPLYLEASNREEIFDTNRKSMNMTKNRLSILEYSELLVNAIIFYYEYVNGISASPVYESSLESKSESKSDEKEKQEKIEQNEFDLKYHFDGEEYSITFRGKKITLIKVKDGRDFFLIGDNILLINWGEQEDYKLNLEDYDILNILEQQFNTKVDRNKIKPYSCDIEQKQLKERNAIKEALQKIINSL